MYIFSTSGGRILADQALNKVKRQPAQSDVQLALTLENLQVHFAKCVRDLRMGKVKQKFSGCFRQQQYAAAYCRISSYLQTMAYRGYNPLVAIQLALTGKLTTAGV